MEPGKIPHEIRHGELAQLGILPYQPYYGTHDATSLFVIVLSYLYHWGATGRSCVDTCPTPRRRWPGSTAMATATRTGFQEYKTRSTHGYYNQGWKDAGDAIVEADGTLAALPIATCELQGYVYDAKLRMADVYEVLGAAEGRPRACGARRSACTSGSTRRSGGRRRGPTTWGSTGPSNRSGRVASNAGHLLQSGIVPPERAGARRPPAAGADDMWSGWGVRTLSSDHVAYNPFSYQTGTVWPHDNAMIAGGFRRYGFDAEAAQVAKGIFDAAERLLGVPAAGAVRRPAAARGELPRPVPRARTCRRRGRPARSCGSSRSLPASTRRPTRRARAVRQPGAARLAARADDPQPAGGRRLAVISTSRTARGSASEYARSTRSIHARRRGPPAGHPSEPRCAPAPKKPPEPRCLPVCP